MENEENIRLIQQVYMNFGAGDIPGVLAMLTDDVRWNDPGYPDVPYAAKRNGKAEVLEFFKEMTATVSFTRFDPQEFYSDQDAVIVKGIFAGNSLKANKPFESEWVMIWKIRDGKIYFYQAWVDTLAMARSISS